MNKNNPSLLDLLKMGAKVEFDDETWLHGEPKTGYIQIGYMGLGHGCWSLDENGLKEAMEDRLKIYAEQMGDNFDDLTGSDGYIGGIGIKKKSDVIDDIADYTMYSRGKYIGVQMDHLHEYSIVNEDGVILEGSDTRVEVRQRFAIRLAKALAEPKPRRSKVKA